MKKDIYTFAVFNAKEQFKNVFVGCFFYALTQRKLPTYKAIKLLTFFGLFYITFNSCSLARTEGDSLSSFYLFSNFNFSQKFMPKNNEIETNVKHSNVTSTPTERNTVSIEQFTTELNAKNKAYAFILLTGQLHHFERFCQTIKVFDNPHDLCIALLKEDIKI